MEIPPIHKGWHSRGYLPHFDSPGQIQALTFRLADSVPAKILAGWKAELGADANPGAHAKLRAKIAHYEDAGYGACVLRSDANAAIVDQCLHHDDGLRYRLLEWCIMPNHVHVMIEALEGTPLGEVVKIWKTFSAKRINEASGRSGRLWEPDYHDRYIRDQNHYEDARAYIRENPVRAGLCRAAADWRWGSAFKQR